MLVVERLAPCLDSNVPRKARRKIYASMINLPDALARTVGVSAWHVYAEVLAQVGRDEMANLRVLQVTVWALLDHAFMIEGAHAASLAEKGHEPRRPPGEHPPGHPRPRLITRPLLPAGPTRLDSTTRRQPAMNDHTFTDDLIMSAFPLYALIAAHVRVTDAVPLVAVTPAHAPA
ncbi:hypothetical protein HII36_23185 [Nonomuraea sp. NN258]|uniref:hypothetical protein n=1 Tax=Nonomuraea antri TaxID=2730852 RepID=UPI0015687A02|nr:hypothetical protein [Nonomuraea antri]NRQ34713.1 hypothetical protein [Nonomuraea antri]